MAGLGEGKGRAKRRAAYTGEGRVRRAVQKPAAQHSCCPWVHLQGGSRPAGRGPIHPPCPNACARLTGSRGERSAGSSSLLAMRAVTTDPSATPTSPDNSPQPALTGFAERGTPWRQCIQRQAGGQARDLGSRFMDLLAPTTLLCHTAPGRPRLLPPPHSLRLRRLCAWRITAAAASGSSTTGCGPSAMAEMWRAPTWQESSKEQRSRLSTPVLSSRAAALNHACLLPH